MKYFANITDETQARSVFNALSKKLHSDRGGDDSEFQKMKEEYDDWKVLKKYNKLEVQKKPAPERTRASVKRTKKATPEPPPPPIAVQQPPQPQTEESEFLETAEKIGNGIVALARFLKSI
jgi:hypothetical protein